LYALSFSRTKHTKKLDKDPTNTIAQNTKILMKKNNIPSKTKSLKSTNPLPSRLYYQKYTNHPSQINCQRHTLSDIQFIPRFLVQTLQPLTGKSESHIINSMDFIQRKDPKNPTMSQRSACKFRRRIFLHKFQ